MHTKHSLSFLSSYTFLNITFFAITCIVSTHSHLSIVIIIILSPYSLSPLWWQWRRWLWKPSLLLKSHEWDSQRNVGGGHSWSSRALLTPCCRSSLCWWLNSKVVCVCLQMGLQEGQFAATVSQSLRVNIGPSGIFSTDLWSFILGLCVASCCWKVLQTGWYVGI